MNTTDPIHEALDRLAKVADTHPVADPMPGVTRRARANRRRTVALSAGASSLVVVAGLGFASVLNLPDPAGSLGYADSPSPSPSPAPRTPAPSPTEPALGAYDRARADVDGDGVADTVSVRLPEADAAEGQDSSLLSKDVRLHVRFAAGTTAELRFGEVLAPTIAATPDLDGNGTAEVVLSFSGGDAAWLKAFTWHDGTIDQAEPAPGSPADLVDDGGLYSSEEVASSSVVDGELISWVGTDDTSEPFEVRVWTWQLEGKRLVATEEEQLQCTRPGQHPQPC